MIDWLLEGDPAIRWQVMADLLAEPSEIVARERSRVAREGWGARLLGLQDPDTGKWGGGTYSPKWVSTTYTLLLLRHLGLKPGSNEARRAIRLVRDKVRWIRPREEAFFDLTGEVCVTGMVVAIGSYFGMPELVQRPVEWLAGSQLDDGGWNCDAPEHSNRSSFHTTISVLEAFLEYERNDGPNAAELAERRRLAEEYLLERRLFRSKRTGEVVNRAFTLFSFPPRWHYDVLRGLDYLRESTPSPDPRCVEALDLVISKRRRDGRWPLQNPHPGQVHFDMDEGAGKPSRWNTLRASRVLRWAGVD